jgi:hypothetical protein
MGQFLGFSPEHSTLVGLVRNLTTEHVSPQWHLVYDERFETVSSTDEDNVEESEIWTSLFNDPQSRDWYFDESSTNPADTIPELDDEWLDDSETTETGNTRRRRRRSRRLQQLRQAQQAADPDAPTDGDTDSDSDDPVPPCDNSTDDTPSLITNPSGETTTTPAGTSNANDSDSEDDDGTNADEGTNQGELNNQGKQSQEVPPQGELSQDHDVVKSTQLESDAVIELANATDEHVRIGRDAVIIHIWLTNGND